MESSRAEEDMMTAWVQVQVKVSVLCIGCQLDALDGRVEIPSCIIGHAACWSTRRQVEKR